MTEMAAWPDVTSALQIDYAREAMERIRCHALKELETGGRSAGGLLLGERAGAKIRVLNAIEFHRSRPSGPDLQLTPDELHRCRERILGAGTLPVIGWYFSRTHGEMQLEPAELKLFRELFPTEWQITLLLVPNGSAAQRSFRAAFFFRDAGGNLIKGDEQALVPGSTGRGHPHTSHERALTQFPESRRSAVLGWALIAIVSLLAGAAVFEFQNLPAKVVPSRAPHVLQVP